MTSAELSRIERFAIAFSQAKQGRVARVSIKAHGAAGVSCACLPIVLDEDVAGFNFLQPVYLPGVRGAAYRELANFVLVGYFTGREIDLRQYYRELGLPPEWAVESEDTPDPAEKFPEFCLEAWCHSLPTIPADNELARERSIEHHAELLEQGVPECRFR